MPIHHNLKKLREQRNLSQQEVAASLNISQNAYSALETGKTKIDEARIHQLADFLKVPFTDLMIDREHSLTATYNLMRINVSEIHDLIELLKNEISVKNTQITMLHKLLERDR